MTITYFHNKSTIYSRFSNDDYCHTLTHIAAHKAPTHILTQLADIHTIIINDIYSILPNHQTLLASYTPEIIKLLLNDRSSSKYPRYYITISNQSINISKGKIPLTLSFHDYTKVKLKEIIKTAE